LGTHDDAHLVKLEPSCCRSSPRSPRRLSWRAERRACWPDRCRQGSHACPTSMLCSRQPSPPAS